VILVGDFFQLPPVSRGSDMIDFAFENPAWRTFRLAICVLTVQYRQVADTELNPEYTLGDPLLQILNEIRAGEMSENSHTLLRSRNIPVTTEDHTELFTRNISVDSYNTDRLNQIRDDTFVFEMQSK
jgi:ATP-dependent DNA helicase PIF1